MASSTGLLTMLTPLWRAHQTCHACPSVRLVAITDTLHLHFNLRASFALFSSPTSPITCIHRRKHVVGMKVPENNGACTIQRLFFTAIIRSLQWRFCCRVCTSVQLWLMTLVLAFSLPRSHTSLHRNPIASCVRAVFFLHKFPYLSSV